MEHVFTVIVGTLVSVLIAVLTVLSLLILSVIQKVHDEAVHTNGRLRVLEGKGIFRAGQKAERLKHTKPKRTGAR